MAMAPHWLDDVLENVRDADELLQTMMNSPELQTIAQKAFEAGELQRKAFAQNPKLCAPSVSQKIRCELLSRLDAPTREEALASALA